MRRTPDAETTRRSRDTQQLANGIRSREASDEQCGWAAAGRPPMATPAPHQRDHQRIDRQRRPDYPVNGVNLSHNANGMSYCLPTDIGDNGCCS